MQKYFSNEEISASDRGDADVGYWKGILKDFF